ncbi:MAG: 4-hydroxythreonine-4-phosphate dehydrogenase PdxA, partial [Candidatus Omnitrophica bacterium]|nr:4-hydroxythreonine-4-phosphate dehydrogenase PdxA [Candidatus Omnitrophota bacterium]
IPHIERVKPGQASGISGKASLEYLKASLEIMKSKGIGRLVTAPLSKEAVKLVLPHFYGHTEYLAEYFKVKKFEMMFASKQIKIVPLTRHIPLREVPALVKTKFIFNSLLLIYSSLQEKFRITSPKIAFTSLNPHAGKDTFLEIEEKAISNAISKFPQRIYGPYPADTLFLKENLNKYDCIICLYHDQAMIPFKLLFWRNGVNITLGLPIIRTSPVHGVAYNLLRQQDKIEHSSMLSAIKLAAAVSL